MSGFTDLSGQKFGRLLVIEYAYSKKGRRCWRCRCDCGKFVDVDTHSLTTGNTKSCGCLKRETVRNFNIKTKSKIDQDNIIGQTFDFLEVIEKDEIKSSKGNTYYICKCSNCGNIKSIRYSDIISERVHACGCLNSWGEAQLKLILNKYKIEYEAQYSFDDLRSEKDYPLRFDFAILNGKKLVGLIEYQGAQHTRESSTWHTNSLVLHDRKKIEYCKQYNIPLVFCNEKTDLDTFVKEVVFQWLPLEFSL